MIQTLRKSAYKHGYLILTAAWLYTLSFIIINYWGYTSSPDRVQKKLGQYIKKSETAFEQLCSDTASLLALTADTAAARQDLFGIRDQLNFYVYERKGNKLNLCFWNTHVVIPSAADLEKKDGKYFVKYANGEFEFLKKTIFSQGREIVAAGMVTIRHKYFWNNKYLRTEFEAFHELEERYDIDANNSGIAIRNGDGSRLFSLIEKPKGKMTFSEYDSIPLIIRLIAIIFLLIFVNFVALDVVKFHGWRLGFGFLLLLIVGIRLVTYFFNFPFDFRKLELFDVLIYASSWLHRSLGDLLINTILIFWIVTFLKSVSLQPLRSMAAITGRKGWFVTAGLGTVLLTMSFAAAGLVRSLIIDSKISFDVSDFFSLSVFTLLSFIILCFIALSFFYFSHIVLLLTQKCTHSPAWVKYMCIAVLGLIYLTIHFNNPFTTENLLVLAWLLLYVLLFEYRSADLHMPLLKSPFFLMWLILFASSVSTLIIFQNRNSELQQRKRIAEKLADQADPFGENLLSLAVDYYSNPFLAGNFNRFKWETSNKFIKDSLIGENFSGYLNKYDTRIYTFDAGHNPLFNDDSASYEILTNIITNQSKKTRIANLYYYENSLDRFSFIFENDIKDYEGNVLGYFFVIAKPKRYKSESLYPELFKQVKDLSSDLMVNYDYAVYSKGDILSHFGDHPFPSQLSRGDYPKMDFEVRKFGDNNELWHKAANNKVVVIIKKGWLIYEAITLFAYLFGSFLFIIVLFHLGSFLFRSRFRWRSIKGAFRFSIRNQIEFTIVFISIFSFVVIGVATIKFYIDRFKKTNNERLARAMTMMSNELQNQIASRTLFDDAVKIYEQGANDELETTIASISEMHSVDVNFYDVNGILRVSTQPYIYNKHILSEMMEPVAYNHLHFQHDIKYTQDENVGRFRYVSMYVPVKGHDGQTYAYLNIPYLNSQIELNQEISNFLVTLINLNAFIFILANAIALLLTSRIIRSFSLIENKMKDINLGKYNEQITWKSNDEIGTLVIEYNKMVKKLEDSALALAKSEREGAWREMARQVAHEIKNPLTPMKLSIQYLQRSIDENKPDVQALAKKVSATLVEQIDQLAKIASDFSQFANIGNVTKQVFDVNDVLSSLVDLHSTNKNVRIQWQRPKVPAFINADRLQLNRLFTNLVQNAIEANAGDGQTVIKIKQRNRNGVTTISMQDNGPGIPVEMHHKIFTPNFTTKTSGTGLGLAICKGIVEKASGSIWFITSPDEGTTFYVSLPLTNTEEQQDDIA